MIQYTPLTIAQAEEHKSSEVWVVNKTRGEKRSQIVFTAVGDASGTVITLNVPLTWIPVMLTSSIPKRYLLDSIGLRSAVEKKLIEIIPPDVAHELMDSKLAKKEKARLDGMNETMEALARRSSTLGAVEMIQVDRSGANPAMTLNSPSSQPQDAETAVAGLIVAFCGSMTAESDEDNAINTLLSFGPRNKAEYAAVIQAAQRFGFKELEKAALDASKET